MKIIFAGLLILFGNLSFSAQAILVNEDYAVYATVLRDIYKDLVKKEELSGGPGKLAFVILDRTKTLDRTKSLDSSKTPFDETFYKLKVSEIIRDFASKNKSSVKLQKRISVNYQYSLVGKSKIDKLLELGKTEVGKEQQRTQMQIITAVTCGDDFWQIFRKNYPNADGYYQFSRTGFNSNKTFAYVEVSGKGGSWESNMAYILRKAKGKWKIVGGSGGFGVC